MTFDPLPEEESVYRPNLVKTFEQFYDQTFQISCFDALEINVYFDCFSNFLLGQVLLRKAGEKGLDLN